jgi:hypothetical protein
MTSLAWDNRLKKHNRAVIAAIIDLYTGKSSVVVNYGKI